jgi:hypothetical protein
MRAIFLDDDDEFVTIDFNPLFMAQVGNWRAECERDGRLGWWIRADKNHPIKPDSMMAK